MAIRVRRKPRPTKSFVTMMGGAALVASLAALGLCGSLLVAPSASASTGGLGGKSHGASTQPVGIPGTWVLKQSDEFNAKSLNTAIWQAGWFGSGVTGPVNTNEVACYNSNNVTFPGDGTVHLNVTATPSTCGGENRPDTGALLSSNPDDGRASGGYQYTYGAMEARVYIPASAAGEVANWPAVWEDGQNWPSTGELDVMEGLSGQACFHFISPSGDPGSCVAGTFTGWHTFASDWESGSVTYYYDGVDVGKITEGVTASPMYLVLDNTVTSYTGNQTTVPATMRVDYIRVWQHS